MPTTTVNFEIDPDDTDAQWIAVDDKDVPLVGHKGSVDVDNSLPKHTLTWWFRGDGGTTTRIKGTVVGKPNPVVDVTSSIPSGEHDGGGRRRFTV
jgi:hypothetical protein